MSLFGNSVSFLDPMGPYDYSVSTHTPYIGLMDWRGRWAVDHHSRNGSGAFSNENYPQGRAFANYFLTGV